MSDTFVRTSMLAPSAMPIAEVGIVGWIRRNLLAGPGDAILTILACALILYTASHLLNWLVIQAIWIGTDRTVCATVTQGGLRPDGWSGACWAFVGAKFEQFVFGRYPFEERWRPILVAGLLVLLLVPMLVPSIPRKTLNALLLLVPFPVVSFSLLYGGFGLPIVETALWGGLMVTLVLSFVGIAVSFPFGILLALGRQSKLPLVRWSSIAFIEVIRGVPLITVLFMASVMLPLFLPVGWTVDQLLRAVIGVSIFGSAYMAEVIRGGLQAVPKGQYEGADSLGLSYWHKMWLIIVPQAIKLVIPGIVNTFIGMFKDTSLVSIIGMFDLLGIVRLNFGDPVWATPVTPMTGLMFAGFVFWFFCFGMSKYSGFIERTLDTGRKS